MGHQKKLIAAAHFTFFRKKINLPHEHFEVRLFSFVFRSDIRCGRMGKRCEVDVYPYLLEIRSGCMPIEKETMRYFETRVIDFFEKAGREHLPWRKEGTTAYEIWVSEIMLQQTQVSRVIGYYDKFLKRFPTVAILAEASWEEFLPYYQGLGYYARGRNMLLTARVVVKKHGGVFPASIEELDALPGIGPYTAAAIASFAYDQNTLAWDTNLRRVVGRFFFGTKRSERISELDGRFREQAKILNAALMDLGSSLCTSRPKCAACPLVAKCQYWREKGKQESSEKSVSGNLMAVDWKKAPIYIVLHTGHRRYFSENGKTYQPFVLPDGFTDRAGIKQWFLEHHNLNVSVRPPKRDAKSGAVLVNVQILAGEPAFVVYPREAFRKFIEAHGTPSVPCFPARSMS